MPPELAAAKERTNTPNTSILALMPAAAPLRANTKVPIASSVRTRILIVWSLIPMGEGTLYSFPVLRPFALSFCGTVAAQTPAKLDPPVKPAVSGKFTGNGKNAAIKFVTAEEHEPFGGKEAITLLFTEKDPAKSKMPESDATVGNLGSALILKVHLDGTVFGCHVVHSAHKKHGFTWVGETKVDAFKVAGGNVSGHVSTGKEVESFGEKWEVDLTFAAPLPATLRAAGGNKRN